MSARRLCGASERATAAFDDIEVHVNAPMTEGCRASPVGLTVGAEILAANFETPS